MLDQIWLPLATVLLLSAVALAPMLPALVREWVAVTRLAPHRPAIVSLRSVIVEVALPEAPGTPGTTLARAPSH